MDLERFYLLLKQLEADLGGKRKLIDCSGKMVWPARGVYFFFEEDEDRSDSGVGPRVVRVGTHGLKAGSKSTLWGRLSQHRGSARDGGGNHRGSIFRSIVGAALAKADGAITIPTWGQGQSAPRDIRLGEIKHEKRVSAVIGSMPFLWLAINDEPHPSSLRGLIERNSIALLSNHGKVALDPSSPDWLGLQSDRPLVCSSGLWNNNHVGECYAPDFLDVFERLVAGTRSHC